MSVYDLVAWGGTVVTAADTIACYGVLGSLVDAIHLPASTKITTHDICFQGDNAELKANTGTAIPLYRFLDDPVQFADGGLASRAWVSRRT